MGEAGLGCASDRTLRREWQCRPPALVIVVDPVREFRPGMIESEEQALVEKLVAPAAIEALAKAVLHRLSGRNEMPDDPVVLRPGQNGLRGEHRTAAPAKEMSLGNRASGAQLFGAARTA